jgi:hypothetical protein
MAYVDLSPIRAGMSVTLEASDYTGVQARLLPQLVEGRLAQALEEMRRKEKESQPGEGGSRSNTRQAVVREASNQATPAPQAAAGEAAVAHGAGLAAACAADALRCDGTGGLGDPVCF